MQFTLRATRQTPHGASRLVQAMSTWLVKTRRGPSRHCRNARIYVHTTTAMHKLSTPPLPRPTPPRPLPPTPAPPQQNRPHSLPSPSSLLSLSGVCLTKSGDLVQAEDEFSAAIACPNGRKEEATGGEVSAGGSSSCSDEELRAEFHRERGKVRQLLRNFKGARWANVMRSTKNVHRCG